MQKKIEMKKLSKKEMKEIKGGRKLHEINKRVVLAKERLSSERLAKY
jgi:bacteriocin-like protein